MDWASNCLRVTDMLLGLSLLVQTGEFFYLQRSLSDDGIWAWRVQQQDFGSMPDYLRAVFSFLSRRAVLFAHLCLRVLASVLLIFGILSWLDSLFLFVGTIAIVVRWRGAFNGGSDFMTIAVLTGVLIAHGLEQLGLSEFGPRLGLIYIAVQSASSYFISGWVKLLSADWRNGRALIWFLDTSIYGPLPATSQFRRPFVAALASWGFILWEGTLPLALMDIRLTLAFCAGGMIFHFLVFWYFGLNRFFFAWIASYPALIFLASQLA
jgi:hypothetical protein